MSDSEHSSAPSGAGKPRVLGRPEKQPLMKRFYKDVTVAAAGNAFRVLLDGRPLKTPGKLVLAVPNEPLAEAIAAEWRAQGAEINPMTMPLIRLINTALDAVSGREAEVAVDIVKYAGSDLICYRAESPAGLVAKQSAAWDPLIAWAASELGASFTLAKGILHVTQPAAALEAIRRVVTPCDALHLSALHVLTTLMGSCILALAVAKRHLDADAAWSAAHVDEDWQLSQWGEDTEAAQRRLQRRAELQAAVVLLELA